MSYISLDLVVLLKNFQSTGQISLFIVDYDRDSIRDVEHPNQLFAKNLGKLIPSTPGTVKKEMKCAMDEWFNHPETGTEFGLKLVDDLIQKDDLFGYKIGVTKMDADKNGNLLFCVNLEKQNKFGFQ